MKEKLRTFWRIARWPLGLLVLLYAGLVIWRIPAVREKDRSAVVVAQIQAQKLTLADVMGVALPPTPDPIANNATLAGIDINHNGIRDDVEFAIFKAYPKSARIREAELQYAMELQNEMTNVFSTDTLVAVMQAEGRGIQCISDATPDARDLSQTLALIQKSKKDVEGLVLNVEVREEKHKEIFDKYMTSFSELQGPYCDIDLSTLPN